MQLLTFVLQAEMHWTYESDRRACIVHTSGIRA